MQVFKELKSVRSSRKRVTEPNFPGLAIPFPPVVERKRKKKKPGWEENRREIFGFE